MGIKKLKLGNNLMKLGILFGIIGCFCIPFQNYMAYLSFGAILYPIGAYVSTKEVNYMITYVNQQLNSENKNKAR